MTESLDEAMTGMGDPADYDDTPEPPDRLTELAVGLAELAGLTIGPPLPAEAVTPVAVVRLVCGRCNGIALLIHLRLDPGVTQELFETHVCTAGVEPLAFPFTLAVRNAT